MGGGNLELPTAKVGDTTVALLGDLVKSDKFLRMSDVHLPAAYMQAYRSAVNGSGVDYLINFVLGNTISEENAQKELVRCLEFSIFKAFELVREQGKNFLVEKDKAIIANNFYKKLILNDTRLRQEIANRIVDKLYKILQEGNSVACGNNVLQMSRGDIFLRDVVNNTPDFQFIGLTQYFENRGNGSLD